MFLFKAHPAIAPVAMYMQKFKARSGVEIPLPIPKAMIAIFYVQLLGVLRFVRATHKFLAQITKLHTCSRCEHSAIIVISTKS